jgi:hypothetical protein
MNISEPKGFKCGIAKFSSVPIGETTSKYCPRLDADDIHYGYCSCVLHWFEVIKSGVKAFPTPDRITPFWHPDTCSLRLVPKTEGEQETIKGISGGDPR